MLRQAESQDKELLNNSIPGTAIITHLVPGTWYKLSVSALTDTQ